jgi:hypothetical protein
VKTFLVKLRYSGEVVQKVEAENGVEAYFKAVSLVENTVSSPQLSKVERLLGQESIEEVGNGVGIQ